MSRDPLLLAFDRRVRLDPAATLSAGPRSRLSVGGVEALASGVADRLSGCGIRPDEPVGLIAPNGPGFLAGLVALRRRQAVAVLIDERTREPERERLADELELRVLLRLTTAWPRSADAFRLILHEDHEPERLHGAAVVKLTSGSGGRVRGVVTSSAALLADDAALRSSMGIGDGDRLLAAVPFSHSYGLSSLVVPALACGLPLIVPDAGGPLAPIEAAAAGATVFPTVPAYLDALVRLATPPPLPDSLRLVISAGAPLAPATARLFRERYARPVHVFYGASECGGIAYDRDGAAAERGSVGRPVDGVAIDLAEDGRVVVRSRALASAYWPEPRPARLDGKRFVTDDLAELRDGELRLAGRVGSVINVRGSKVHPAEVERVLRDLPAVEDCAVVPAADGGDSVRLRAVVACRPGSLTAEAVVAWCRDRLAAYKVPRRVSLVERLPRTARGKLDRRALNAIDAPDAFDALDS